MASAGYSAVVGDMRKIFLSGKTKSLSWRKQQLEALLQMIEDKREEMCEAIKKDLNKPRSEAVGMEVNLAMSEAIELLDNIDKWTAPQPVKKNMVTMMDTCYIKPEPYGTVLIMGAWNYPVQLTLVPLLGAIGAGNCAIIKPSELSENTAKLLEVIIPQYLDQECIKVIAGGVPETTLLLKERFDYIFYTGSSMVGKIIMEAAAKHLTPVTLELGGKSPCYVDKSSDLTVAARRIIWGKFVNSGQTCIAPDYVICPSSIKNDLLSKMKETAVEFWGEDVQKSPDFGRMINNRHFHRVKKLLDSGDIYSGGGSDENDRYIEPTILHNVKPDDPVMQEEIFGPVLPVLTMDDFNETLDFIRRRERPLSSYIFSRDNVITDKWITEVACGGMCINDVIMHTALNTLPFGGVGNSGMGGYHGKFTFDTFTHNRSVMIKSQGLEKVNSLRYPPYTQKKQEWIAFLMDKKRKKSGGIMSFFPLVIVGAIIAFAFRVLGLSAYLPKSLNN